MFTGHPRTRTGTGTRPCSSSIQWPCDLPFPYFSVYAGKSFGDECNGNDPVVAVACGMFFRADAPAIMVFGLDRPSLTCPGHACLLPPWDHLFCALAFYTRTVKLCPAPGWLDVCIRPHKVLGVLTIQIHSNTPTIRYTQLS